MRRGNQRRLNKEKQEKQKKHINKEKQDGKKTHQDIEYIMDFVNQDEDAELDDAKTPKSLIDNACDAYANIEPDDNIQQEENNEINYMLYTIDDMIKSHKANIKDKKTILSAITLAIKRYISAYLYKSSIPSIEVIINEISNFDPAYIVEQSQRAYELCLYATINSIYKIIKRLKDTIDLIKDAIEKQNVSCHEIIKMRKQYEEQLDLIYRIAPSISEIYELAEAIESNNYNYVRTYISNYIDNDALTKDNNPTISLEALYLYATDLSKGLKGYISNDNSVFVKYIAGYLFVKNFMPIRFDKETNKYIITTLSILGLERKIMNSLIDIMILRKENKNIPEENAINMLYDAIGQRAYKRRLNKSDFYFLISNAEQELIYYIT